MGGQQGGGVGGDGILQQRAYMRRGPELGSSSKFKAGQCSEEGGLVRLTWTWTFANATMLVPQ